MNPAEIEKDIRSLEIMLYGGAPLRPSADFGQGEVGYLESAKVRDPLVHRVLHQSKKNTEIVVERRVIKGKKIIVGGPKSV